MNGFREAARWVSDLPGMYAIPIVLAPTVAVAVLVSACAPNEPQPPAQNTAPNGTTNPPAVTTFPVMVNGRQVWCVWAESRQTYNGTGLSCDFTRETEPS